MVALVGAPGLLLAGDAFSVLGLRVGFIALFAGSTWLMARSDGALLRPLGRGLGRPGPQRLWLFRDGGRYHRPAGRPAAILLALDS